MQNYQEEFLAHYGVLGMKWGQRKQRSTSSSINRDRRKLQKQYRKEYRAKKLSGQNTTIGSGAHRKNLSKTNYASVKADQDLKKKYGTKAVNQNSKQNKSRQLKAAAAGAAVGAAILGGTMLKSATKSKNINVGKSILNGLEKANYKVGYAAGRTVATVNTLKRKRK